MGKRKTLVTDTTLWIDLDKGELVLQIFRLPYKLVVPDVMISQELEEPDGFKLIALGLETEELSGTEVSRVSDYARKYKRPSRHDLFALVLAQRLNCPLITGDLDLRVAAEQEGVEVHGTLWILDKFVEMKIVTPKTASSSLQKMRAAGRRLPKDECQKRIDMWTKK
jgi:predicted nucleic acid-binding protein